MDRSHLGQLFFKGIFTIGCPVSQAVRKWALPLDELTKRPGYRFRREERDADLVDGQAAMGSGRRSLRRHGGHYVRWRAG